MWNVVRNGGVGMWRKTVMRNMVGNFDVEYGGEF